MKAIAMGIPVKKDESAVPDYLVQIWKFLKDYKLSQRDESHSLMKQTLEEFSEHARGLT
jgi:hypothetical protein